jgi:membrane protein DedA with SNARE-associated domain
MLTLNLIRHFASGNAGTAYLLIVLGMVIEGEIVVVLAGIFAHLGSLNLFFIILSIIIGGSIKSFIWYSVGFYLQKNHSKRKFLSKTENRINYFLPNFLNKPFLSIFLSRFLILGMHSFALIFAGYKKTKLNIYIRSEVSSLFVWTMVMLSLGFFFSFTALSISHDVRKFLVVILIGFIAFFILEKIIAFVIELFEVETVDK